MSSETHPEVSLSLPHPFSSLHSRLQKKNTQLGILRRSKGQMYVKCLPLDNSLTTKFKTRINAVDFTLFSPSGALEGTSSRYHNPHITSRRRRRRPTADSQLPDAQLPDAQLPGALVLQLAAAVPSTPLHTPPLGCGATRFEILLPALLLL